MRPAGSRFVGNTVSLAASTVLATVLAFAQMKILAASLPLATFGLFASLRGLSLLVAILAANGFPQALVRFLPEHAARGQRAAATRASVVAILATTAASVVMLLAVVGLRRVFMRDLPDDAGTPLMLWFSVTTLAVALKLVLYGGFNGLRRFGTQTVLETAALAFQVGWMWLERDSLDLVRLFEILGITSLTTAAVAIPWFAARLSAEVRTHTVAPAATTSYARYWAGAVALSVVALAFTDVDRWILSNVLALEVLSLFHVASRIVRLASRFIAIPVLTFQPEITRIQAEGRRDEVGAFTRAFFKASVMTGAFACVAIAAYSTRLIELASGPAFLGARTTLILLALSIPLSAMSAPLTAVMKALDGVRAAFYCDLAWACVYVGLMIACAPTLGLEGTGVAQLSASAVQLVLAARLAKVRPATADALAALVKSLACAVVAFVPVWWLVRVNAALPLEALFGAVATWVFVHLARRARVLAPEERERLRLVLARRGVGPALAWFIP